MIVFIRFLFIFLAVYWVVRKLKIFLAPHTQQNTGNSSHNSSPQDPYLVLGVSRTATQTEIHNAYKKAIAEYHPDKVMHLGVEIQNLAQQKTAAFNTAYQKLKR